MAEPYEQKKVVDLAHVIAQCDEFEAAIAELRGAYEQYFLGLEKKPPLDQHAAVKKQAQKLKSLWARQTAAKFRVQTVTNKLQTYERMWQRTIQEIENGTYHRDVQRARRKQQASALRTVKPQSSKSGPQDDFSIDEVSPEEAAAILAGSPLPQDPSPGASSTSSVAPAIPKVTPVRPVTVNPTSPVSGAMVRPAAPGGGAQKSGVPAPAGASRPPGSPGLSDDKLRAVYDAYVKARRRCNEDTSSMSFDQVASTLRKQVPELMKKHNAKSVEFKVVIKDGKAVLRAVPKEG